MIEPWVLVLALFFTVLFGVVIVLLMRVLTTLEVIVRAIPLGAPKVMERRPSTSEERERPTRPVGSTAQHARG